MRTHGPWTIKSTQQIYADAWLNVQVDQVTRPDGLPGTYSTVQLRPGVCVIAVDEQQQVHLTREFHYAVGRFTLEGVSGGIEEGETPELAAERELAEELGLVAAQWTRLGQVDPFTSAIASTVDLYLAQQLSHCDTALEGTEQIEHIVMPFERALDLVRHSEITHAPTCVAMLRIALDGLCTRPMPQATDK